MGRFTYALNDGNAITIPSGSDRVTITVPEDAISFLIYAPATLNGTVTVYVEPTRPGTAFVPLQEGGVNVTIPQDVATQVQNRGFRQLQLRASLNQNAATNFRIAAHCETSSGV
jgi:hypothetical protein